VINPEKRSLKTEEVVELLHRESDAPVDLAWAFVASWVGMLRYVTVVRLQDEPGLLGEVSRGEGRLELDADLAPLALRELQQPEPGEWVSREIGLDPRDTNRLLQRLTGAVRPRGEAVEFEPVGTIQHAPVDAVRGGIYVAFLRPDFLRPEAEDVEEGAWSSFAVA
jgi:hypothetical protein